MRDPAMRLVVGAGDAASDLIQTYINEAQNAVPDYGQAIGFAGDAVNAALAADQQLAVQSNASRIGGDQATIAQATATVPSQLGYQAALGAAQDALAAYQADAAADSYQGATQQPASSSTPTGYYVAAAGVAALAALTGLAIWKWS